jgi:hypothetical protein
VPGYPSVVSLVISFDWSAVFFVSFCPSGVVAKLTVVGLVVVVVVVVDVVVCDGPPLFGPVFFADEPESSGPCDVGPLPLPFVEPVVLGPALAGVFG